MANYELVTIQTENKEVFESLEKFFEQDNKDFGFYHSEDGTIEIRNRHGYTIEHLLEISNLHKDVSILATFAFESERYGRDHKYEVMNGDFELLDIVETIPY